ncbi:hypothetical protein F5883DRAFT_441364 [Diaporthe sp. PMI_573]|nr:hypothetical protein F5883DRAFT_441364 [Diaporthaceae sp. PMI_573]
MPTEQPTILFVPGAWHFPAGFDAVRELLKPFGYPTEAVAHPSVGAEPPNKTLKDDTANTRAEIEKLAEAGKKVVLVAHSYGGIVGSSAVEGLGFEQRKAVGKEGGVINFVYLTAFALPKGTGPRHVLGDAVLPDFMLLRCRVKSFEELFLESIRVLAIQHLFHYYVDNMANASNPSLQCG